jgi:hypothetical protein
MHLAMFADVANVHVMRHEREAPWPSLRLRETEALGNHRSKPVRADHDRRPNLTPLTVH